MIRTWLAFFVSGLVLALALYTAWQQAENYARAAELDRLQMESEWFERQCTELRAELERFEFASSAGIGETLSRPAGELHEGRAEEPE